MTVHLGFDADALLGVIQAVQENPANGKTVWKAQTTWQDGFRSAAVIPREGGEHTVPMDEPKQLGGSDTAPNMVEMVLGAYGCCLTTGYVANAALRGIRLEGVDIDVEGDLDLQGFFGLKPPEEVSPGYSEIRATVRLTAPEATPEQLAELHQQVLRTSPVGSILTRPVAVKTDLA